MLNLHKSDTLVSAFAPGTGDTPERDNMAGYLINDLSNLIVHLALDYFRENTKYIKNSDFETLCNTVSWLQKIFNELEE